MEKSFLFHEKDGLEYYTVAAFEQTYLVVHAFSGRNGGISEDDYGNFKFKYLNGRINPENLCGIGKICDILGLDPHSLVGTQRCTGCCL